MAGQLRIVTGIVHSAAQPFVARVEITGAQPADRVQIRLWQIGGTQPLYRGAGAADINASGRGLAEFADVVVHGAGTVAVLVAAVVVEGDEAAVSLRSDELHIEVIP